MTPEIDRIRDQLRRAFEGDAWHGPAVLEVVAKFDHDTARQRVPESGHSACNVVLHIAAWLEIVSARFQGHIIRPTARQDWPPAGQPGEPSWKRATSRLRAAFESLDGALAAADDARLDDTAPGQDYTMYIMLHGAVQHSLYHAGQLMLMYRAVESGRSRT